MRPWVEPVVLEGEWVRLEPLRLHHAPGLLEASDPEVFRHFTAPFVPERVEQFERWIQERTEPGSWGSAVVSRAEGRVVGSTTVFDVRPEHRGLEVGYSWLRADLRGGPANPEMKLLLLRHAFETLGAIRVQLKCDARNLRSFNGIKKLGAVYEGTLRHNVILPDGHRRETAYFSILEAEWPAAKARLLERLEAFR